MSTRLALACSLVSLTACADPKVIGIADGVSEPDGGPVPVEVDHRLAQYASDVRGVWVSQQRPEVKITFAPSQPVSRGGSAVVEGPREACFFFDCSFDVEGGGPRPPVFEYEYWFLRLTATGALVTLPDPTGFPFAINCTYVPASEPRLECGPDGRFIMLRAAPP